MADSYLDKVADELADLALADQAASGDIAITETIGTLLGASSQTLQEAFLTAVRVRRAEERARALLAERKANNYQDGPKPQAAPLQGLSDEEKEAQLDEEVADLWGGTVKPSEDEADAPEPEPSVNMPRRVKR
ncbi:hypothetical protein SAMN04488005_1552 [Yoonia tamlensis]|uniref:Uncharacterized protein n=1 Tax=Yoonia tamlensis TaxID=390270 RepID=A0A1I6GF04_9RHOB|nr:hypothetical protein [Yoonia tamlensis]SFR40766.1 hypothetical protein SAMN04488005_1552 [Yoonia tamlensis]